MNYTKLSFEFNDIIHDAMEGKDLPNIKRRLAIVASKMEAVAESLEKGDTIIAQQVADETPVEVSVDDIISTVNMIDDIRRHMDDDEASIQSYAQRIYKCYVELKKALNDEGK